MGDDYCCNRCGKQGTSLDMPTDRYAKLDGKIHYLCSGKEDEEGCWEGHRRHVTLAEKNRRRSGVNVDVLPPWSVVVDVNGEHHLLEEDWEKYRAWFHKGRREMSGGKRAG